MHVGFQVGLGGVFSCGPRVQRKQFYAQWPVRGLTSPRISGGAELDDNGFPAALGCGGVLSCGPRCPVAGCSLSGRIGGRGGNWQVSCGPSVF